MVRFGQVSGYLAEIDEMADRGRIIIALDSGREVTTVRDEWIPLLDAVDDSDRMAWNADQYTQESIATTLAEQGWEVFGLPQQSDHSSGESRRTATYLVRQL